MAQAQKKRPIPEQCAACGGSAPVLGLMGNKYYREMACQTTGQTFLEEVSICLKCLTQWPQEESLIPQQCAECGGPAPVDGLREYYAQMVSQTTGKTFLVGVSICLKCRPDIESLCEDISAWVGPIP